MFIDPGGGGGAFDAIGESMKSFAKGAASGAFAVNETGGQALLTAIRNMAKWVDDNVGDLRSLAQEPNLGNSHGAIVMKPHLVRVATDEQGFMPMLMKFRESLEDADKGINVAMKNYKSMDHGAAGQLQ